MPRLPRLLVLSCVAGLIFLVRARAAEITPAPRPWEPDAVQPITEARIATLPATEQPAWRDYLKISANQARPAKKPADPVENQAKPMANAAPIPAVYSTILRLDADATWYASDEARTLADRIVEWQRPSGGWTKGGVYTRAPLPSDDHHNAWSAGTFDNDSTIYELRFLARVIHVAGDQPHAGTWRESFDRGLAYVFSAQFPNGGFPQIYPLGGSYHDAITYNDDAMVHILELLRDCGDQQAPFAFVSADVAAKAKAGLERGLACILATQLRNDRGQPTVWGQQHDALTMKPCAARNFEPVSECSSESASLVDFLMTIPQPSAQVKASIEGAMAWFRERALRDVAWDREATTGSALVAKPGAVLWARFYEIGTGRPVFGDRDRTMHYVVTELSAERRKGYNWFNDHAKDSLAKYEKWKKR